MVNCIEDLIYSFNFFITFQDDPLLYMHRTELVKAKAKLLDKAEMIRFEERTGYLYPTDLGRIASNFYIKYDTVEVFNEMFRAFNTEADIFAITSHSQEFQQVKVCSLHIFGEIYPCKPFSSEIL